MPATQLHPIYPLGSSLSDAGVLQIGGCDALELAREFGTPAYVVSEDDLRARARAFVEAFAERTASFEVEFASKAFPCTAVYGVLAQEGIGCDVAGGGELALALAGGFSPDRIHVHGNAKTRRELEEAVEAGVGYVILDSFDEAAALRDVLAAHGARQKVLLRIAPGVSPDTHPAISTGGPNTKFGFSLADAPRAVAEVGAAEAFDLDGLHFHIGSQILDLAPFERALERVAGLGDFPTYNLGGGLGVQYTRDQPAPPSVADYVEAKVEMVARVCGAGKKVMDEPGRALTAHSTVTLYTVQSVKENVSRYVAVDGGMSDNLRVGLYGARYECEVVDRFMTRNTTHPTSCTVAGKHCESTDVIVADARLDDPRPGDVLVTPATGAYGHAMASNYNGALRPPVVFAKDGDARLVVRRETYDDLLARDVG